MSETLPAVKEPTRLDDLARLGQWLAMSESGDQGEKARGAAAALRLYYAAELGVTPMAAAELSVIKGRLYISAQLLRALAVRAGYRVIRDKSTDETCTARILDRNGILLGESTFTIQQAKSAGLIRPNSAWQTHPARMLWARASKNAIVDFAPEVALGIALDDELQEIQEQDPPAPYEVDEDIEFGDPVTADQEAETLAELAALEQAEAEAE